MREGIKAIFTDSEGVFWKEIKRFIVYNIIFFVIEISFFIVLYLNNLSQINELGLP